MLEYYVHVGGREVHVYCPGMGAYAPLGYDLFFRIINIQPYCPFPARLSPTKVDIHFGHVRMCAMPYPISWIIFILDFGPSYTDKLLEFRWVQIAHLS